MAIKHNVKKAPSRSRHGDSAPARARVFKKTLGYLELAVDDIGDDGLRLNEPLASPWLASVLAQAEIWQASGPAALNVLVTVTQDEIDIAGDIRLGATAPCSRCIADVNQRFLVNIDEHLVPETSDLVAQEKGGEHELSEHDVGLSTYADGHVDVAAVLHDEILLALPMQPLCAKDCRGLCSRCGTNLNQSACVCPAAEPCGPLADLGRVRVALASDNK